MVLSDYFVFGGRLRSALEFPDLSAARGDGEPDWELRVEEAGSPPVPIELQGTRWIEPGWVYHLHTVADGLRLDYGGTGSFGIFGGGRKIVWYPGPEPEDRQVQLEMARAIVLGPVMALTLQQAGILCLHGSAVTIGKEAVAFLAPKLHGKSTLALALTAAGARLLTDDLVAIEITARPTVRPGVHSIRVAKDIADRLGSGFGDATLRKGFKTTITNLGEERLAWRSAPLAALYMMEPRPALDNGPAVSREALPPIRAAAALAQGKKVTDGLIGAAGAGSMLDWIARVTTCVPVYRMTLVRDLARLSEVVDGVFRWHGNAVL